MRFLIDDQILDAVQQLVKRNGEDDELLSAVAFWGRGAGQHTGITKRAQPTRILCDLLSGCCNPDEIRRLLKAKRAQVKHLSKLHAKVWVNGDEVIVGSANASINGLGFETVGPSIEAAVHLHDEKFAAKVREWFCREWERVECIDIDKALLKKAEARWKKNQKVREAARNREVAMAIKGCRITAYTHDKYSEEAEKCYNRIKNKYYKKNYYIGERCYEFLPDKYPPKLGTVYMDVSRPKNRQKFKIYGLYKIVRIKRLSQNGNILCLWEPLWELRDGGEFPSPPGCRGRKEIGTMVNCYMRQFYSDHENENYLDMKFIKWYSYQQKLHCKKPHKRCDDCPLIDSG